ncbi:MAG: hypothetical protein ACLQOO_17570 [Terriglobia bacterium]
MYIQYVGFNVAASSRVYNFHVIDTPEEAREFTVKVQPEAFRAARLKLQDGPAICFARLKQELQKETPESPARNNLSIEEHDIREYWERNHPRPPLEHKTESRRWVELNERYLHGSPLAQSNALVTA